MWPHANSISVDVLVIPDQRFFRPLEYGDYEIRDLPINLAKIRQVERVGASVEGSGLQVLQSNPDSPLNFGYRTFRIKTRDQLGSAVIALSIWAAGMPVDEMSVPVCISAQSTGETCVVLPAKTGHLN
jgi:hypothetical protein